MVELEKLLKQKFDERTELTEQQSQFRQDHSTIQGRLDERENKIKSLRQRREQSAGELHNLELRMAEMESEERTVRQRINDEYDLNIDDISAKAPNLELSPELRSERMLELKERMRDFGAVNLLALEEYKTARDRQEFLTTQIDDLLKARTTLQSTITKINQTARRMFLETFEKVRQNFKDVFAELFTGGDANIRLINEDDPLESAIEISARPRGKKLLSITQMSGGERALTAISLLFAIYLVKPSPFCILDEIDAPLDDANIHRFLKIIKTFSDQTQFIIITHNKITMEAADVLYGITMEQPGVSRVVSVRFNQSDEKDIIDTSLSDDKMTGEISLPEAIKDRITPTVNIGIDEDSTD
jgi:chromosome segregation protein